MRKIKGMHFIAIILIFAILFNIGLFKIPVSLALSNVNVTLSDYRPNVGNVKYTISFSTLEGKELIPGDWIDFHFQKKVGSSYEPNTQTVNGAIANQPQYIRINNYTCQHVYYATGSTGGLQFQIPDDFPSEGVRNITVIIDPEAGFTNPSAGIYRIEVKTSKETTPVPSDDYTISQPMLSKPTITVTPALVNTVAQYKITFTTSSYGALTANSDKIRIVFPSQTQLPSSISASSVSVKANGVTKVISSGLTPSNYNVLFTVPEGLTIGANTRVEVTFTASAEIKNPVSTGDYTLKVDTEHSDGAIIDGPTESEVYTISASSISNLHITAAPAQVGATAKYTFEFKTSSVGSLNVNNGKISIMFPDNVDFYIPGAIDKQDVTVNGSHPYDVDVNSFKIIITVSKYISGNNSVTVVINSHAGLKNPTSAGSYEIKVWTSSDPAEVTSTVSISTSSISNVHITVLPPVANALSKYIITFSTGSAGALSPEDSIYIKFPSATYIPSSISPASLLVNATVCSSVAVSNNILRVYVPKMISSDTTVTLIIGKSAGIKNPSTPGSYKIAVHTDKETKDVESAPYVINRGVTTSLLVTPASPDGENNYYKTVPTIKIKIDNPSNLTYTVYFKWDDSAYQKYQDGESIQAPEGKHILYYYAEDEYKNKEDVHSKQFLVDTHKPNLTITSPGSSELTFYNPNIVISGTIDTDAHLAVKVNNTPANVSVDSEGKFNFSYNFPKNGDYVFKLVAEDAAGNSTVSTISVTYISQKRIMLKVGFNEAYVNDKKIILDAKPFILNKRTMVPIRFISESLGADVEWDRIFKIVTITMPSGDRVRLQVGNNVADVKDKAVFLDAPPVIRNNRTFVPIRFIAEAFGAEVDWDPEFMIVRITYPKIG